MVGWREKSEVQESEDSRVIFGKGGRWSRSRCVDTIRTSSRSGVDHRNKKNGSSGQDILETTKRHASLLFLLGLPYLFSIYMIHWLAQVDRAMYLGR